MTDTQLPPELEEPPGHALSTRGYVFAVLGPLLIAAVAISLLWWNYNPNQELQGKNVPIVLSPWHPGSPSNDTVISGVLQIGQDRCVTLQGEGGQALTPVFPAGYVATQTDDGGLNLYDTGHHLIANGGDQIRATGEIAPVGGYAGRPCAPSGASQVSIIESAIVVTQG